MANEEQLSILKQGAEVWNKWRENNKDIKIDLREIGIKEPYLSQANLPNVNLREADLSESNLSEVELMFADLQGANLCRSNLLKADLSGANLSEADLSEVDLSWAKLSGAKLDAADLWGANLTEAKLDAADLWRANLSGANLVRSNLSHSFVNETVFANLDLSKVIACEEVNYWGPSHISTDTLALSKGKIPEIFLRGCGLSDADIEYSKLFNPELNNEEINRILYKIHDLRATQALQISPLFISYSHADSEFVDKTEKHLNVKGIRFWRDIHDLKAGRIETQINRGIRQNPTVLLVLSENSLNSDWVEHEVRTARELEKALGRDTVCPVALDDSWKSSPWPKRVMQQITEYNILDFSAWKDDSKFEDMFRKLIDGLELFYKA